MDEVLSEIGLSSLAIRLTEENHEVKGPKLPLASLSEAPGSPDY